MKSFGLGNATSFVLTATALVLAAGPAFGEGPTTQQTNDSAPHIVPYRSQAVRRLVADAQHQVRLDDWRTAFEAVEIFADLGRADLIAEAFMQDRTLDWRLTILKLMRSLSPEKQSAFLIRALLAENSVFDWGKGSEEATLQEMTVTDFARLLIEIADEAQVRLDATSPAELRAKLRNAQFRGEVRQQLMAANR